MDLNLDQLRALQAAVALGSLDAAAASLHVTPSAVSQRLRGLEVATGQVLLVRSRPVRPTAAGQGLVRLARQIELLLGDVDTLAVADRPGPSMPVLPVAVNADSLATWALPALTALSDRAQVRILRDDESRTGDLLRDGSVAAAVTTQARPVAGCRVTRLGAMRYRPMATPGFVARWFAGGVTGTALAQAPVVRFDDSDDLQHAYLRRRRVPDPPVHQVPSSSDFVAAILLGIGWGMVPDLQAAGPEREGRLVAFDAKAVARVTLHWQRWSLRTPLLDALTESVVAAARAALR